MILAAAHAPAAAEPPTSPSADAAGFSLAPREVSLDRLVEDSTEEFAGPFDAAGVKLETDALAATVVGDPTRLRQVISNLLSNALKFTPTGGLVRVRLGSDEACAVLRVSDTGPGIPPEELPHVFERFFRGRRARAGGSGIGLTVVNDLVRAHGEEVTVASELGEGTTFTVRIPLASSKPRRSFTVPT